MKKLILLILFSLQSIYFYAQNESLELVSKFIILDAKNDGEDVTAELIDAGAFTVFYKNKLTNELSMANVWPNLKSKSFGPIFGVNLKSDEESSEGFKTDYIYFNWSYENDYDDHTGTAKVQLVQVYKPQGIAFTIKIIPEDLRVIVYKGYMEGTIDFSIYD